MTLDDQLRISANLKTLRKAAQLSQAALAEKLAVCRSTYCQYEQGDRLPDLSILHTLSQFYHITIDSLLNCDVQEILKDFFLCEGQTRQERRLLRIYTGLSEFAKGQLVERAEELSRLDSMRRKEVLQINY